MEPQLPTPQGSPESAQPRFKGPEAFPAPTTPEITPERPEAQETRERVHDGPSGDPASVVATPTLPPLPTLNPVAQQSSSATSDDDTPAAAEDVDVMEKAWVEKAKKVVAETKHDPYLQGQEVSRLQADYLKKRYGKTIGLPNDEAA